MKNPYAAPTSDTEKRVYSHSSQRIRGGFLYRVIQFEQPFAGTLVYNGWWFRQKVMIDEHTAWSRISWLTIHREAEFQLPEPIDAKQSMCRIEIDYSRGLWMRRFRIWVDRMVVYDEIN